jgi:hypothetical protein
VGGWSKQRPSRFTPGKETRYPFYRRLGGPQGRSGLVRNISPPPGFDTRTVQPVAGRYTDWANPVQDYSNRYCKYWMNVIPPFMIIIVFSRFRSFHMSVILKQVSCLINLLHFTPYFKINVVLWETRSDVERGPNNSSHNLTWKTRVRRNKIRYVWNC